MTVLYNLTNMDPRT